MRGELTVTAEEEKDLLEYSLIQKMAKMMKISSAEVQVTHSVCPTGHPQCLSYTGHLL